MLCPIMAATAQIHDDSQCAMGNCAWWDAVNGQCAVLSIADSQLVLSNRGD